ncbi:hypothetical protein C8Q78DRAFT_508500 [Trametes maxima]|nr:hypothetical protein C8Q78DRAFT_508500 [Trametes maxima]
MAIPVWEALCFSGGWAGGVWIREPRGGSWKAAECAEDVPVGRAGSEIFVWIEVGNVTALVIVEATSLSAVPRHTRRPAGEQTPRRWVAQIPNYGADVHLRRTRTPPELQEAALGAVRGMLGWRGQPKGEGVAQGLSDRRAGRDGIGPGGRAEASAGQLCSRRPRLLCARPALASSALDAGLCALA